jgi:hypothetical protein
MCKHDTFRYFDHDVPVQQHKDGSQTVRVMKIRVCSGCHNPDILTDSGWVKLVERAP